MDFIVRLYGPEDHPRVTELAERLSTGVADWRSPDKVATAVLGWVQDSMDQTDSEHAMWVAVAQDLVVGFVSASVDAHWSGDRDAYIGELVVAADYEGRGAGRALVQKAERWAADCGLQRIRLTTGAANHGALRMYRSLGYAAEDVTLSRAIASRN